MADEIILCEDRWFFAEDFLCSYKYRWMSI
jgi:hypothetical protein